jgi:hypothetical protein
MRAPALVSEVAAGRPDGQASFLCQAELLGVGGSA